MVSFDFTKKWDLSDVALKMRDSEELLYANKAILAVYSPFFNKLLFGEFSESKQDVVNLDGIDYWPMLEILRILHNVDRRFDEPIPLYSPDKFTHLWKTADGYDFSLIRQLCKQQMTKLHPAEALEVAILCEFHEEKSEILQKMTAEDLQRFFRKRDKELVFSQADAAVIFYKSRLQEVSSSFPFETFDLELEDGQMACSRHRKWSIISESRILPLMYIDFGEKWEMSDITLKMKDGGELFANQAILSAHSSYFKSLFFTESGESKQEMIELKDIEFWPMLQILGVLHHNKRRFDEVTPLFPVDDLVQFWKIAKDYGIPLIRKLFMQQIPKLSGAAGLEIAIKRDLHEAKSQILKKMSFEDVEKYLAKGITEFVFSPADVMVIVEKHKAVEETLIAQAVQALETQMAKELICPQCKNAGFISYINGRFFCRQCHPSYMP